MNETQIINLITGEPALAVGGAALMVGKTLKTIPKFPNWAIPLACLILGGLGYVGLKGWSVLNLIVGMFAGGGATGIHQAIKQLMDRPDFTTPPWNADSDRPGTGGQLSVVLLIGFLIFLPACSTTRSTTSAPEDPAAAARRDRVTAAVLKNIAQTTTLVALRKDSNSRAYFELGVVVLSTALANGDYDPARLQDALAGSSSKELRTGEAFLAITSVLGLYEIFWGDRVSAGVDQVDYLRPGLTGLRDGIVAALAGTSGTQ